MRILEIVLLCFLFVALGWFYSLVPGGASALLIVINLLAIIYFGFGFILFSKVPFRSAFKGGLSNTPGATIGIAALTGLGLSTLAIGILFKLLLMPGADNMLLIGSIESVVMLAVNVFYFLKAKRAASKLCISRLTIFLIPSILLLSTSSMALVKLQYRNHPAYVEAYANYLKDPKNPEKWELVNVEQYRIELTPEEFEMYEKSLSK